MSEYKVEKVSYTTPTKELQERLNGLTREGWELAGIDSRPNGRGTLYIFRRESKPDERPVQGFAPAQAASPKAENL